MPRSSITHVEKAIIQTLSYFDCFYYPLTASELWHWLYLNNEQAVTFIELNNTLSLSRVLVERISSRNGFYYLKGRENLVDIRNERYTYNLQKMKKLNMIVATLSWLPFVRFIAVCNNLAFFNSRKNGDFDLFIITQKGMMPLVRLLAVITTSLFFKRPRRGNERDAVCLSFLVDEDNAKMGDFSISKPDIYLLYWLATLQPMYEASLGYYHAWFYNNQSFLSSLPNSKPRESDFLLNSCGKSGKKIAENILSRIIKPFLPSLFNWQLNRLPKQIKELINTSTAVIINQGVFKTHLNDKRYEIKDKWHRQQARLLG